MYHCCLLPMMRKLDASNGDWFDKVNEGDAGGVADFSEYMNYCCRGVLEWRVRAVRAVLK